jgi:glycosyltransferase involved in cell wall biosynthesis
MRILFLSAWCPYPADNGSKLRVYHLLRGLAQHHEIDLLSFCPEGDDGSRASHLRQFCREVQLLHETPFRGRAVGRLMGLLMPQPRSLVANHSRSMAALACHKASTKPYDVVVASQLHMAPYAMAIRGVPLVLEELELAMVSEPVYVGPPARRLRHSLTWWKAKRYVASLLHQSAGYTVVSPEEAAIAGMLASPGLPFAVVPNGVDSASCAGFAGEPEADTLIYPGALSFDANFDAVAHFAGSILPLIRRARPNVRLRVTGKTTPEQIQALPPAEGLEFTGYLADVRPAVASAWAEVVPLRKGGGTRLKVLEALALGTPVVSTSKGVEGLDLVWGQDVLVADSPEVFAAETLRLLSSAGLRRSLTAAGRAAVTRYDWSHSVERLDALLERAVAGVYR